MSHMRRGIFRAGEGNAGMDAEQFDAISKGLGARAPRRQFIAGVAGGVAALSLVDALAARKGGKGKRKGKGNGKGKGKGKVEVCHKGETINVAKRAVKAHRNHGDALGACPTPSCTGVSISGRCALGCGTACVDRNGRCGETLALTDFCYPNVDDDCASFPETCTADGECSAEQLCVVTGCGPSNSAQGRCVPFFDPDAGVF